MKGHLFSLLPLAALVVSLSAYRISIPRLDYKTLARVSTRLGVDIGMKDNHKLYLGAVQWIGTPYRGGGETRHGTDCSGMTCQIYKKVCHIKLRQSTDGQKKKSSKVARRDLQEGDLVFFSSRKLRRKVAHVGIYFRDGKFVHASVSRGVIVSSLSESYYRTYWISGGRVRK